MPFGLNILLFEKSQDRTEIMLVVSLLKNARIFENNTSIIKDVRHQRIMMAANINISLLVNEAM